MNHLDISAGHQCRSRGWSERLGDKMIAQLPEIATHAGGLLMLVRCSSLNGYDPSRGFFAGTALSSAWVPSSTGELAVPVFTGFSEFFVAMIGHHLASRREAPHSIHISQGIICQEPSSFLGVLKVGRKSRLTFEEPTSSIPTSHRQIREF
ncbi:MAG: hypothetical protein HLUCCO16_21755 [Phormidium sp. OSCR]|nr:MAG: hypothetical protein HLUCCO16_21755 [Phormidium sp. OSCR]